LQHLEEHRSGEEDTDMLISQPMVRDERSENGLEADDIHPSDKGKGIADPSLSLASFQYKQ
jgi:hypothetical protein